MALEIREFAPGRIRASTSRFFFQKNLQFRNRIGKPAFVLKRARGDEVNQRVRTLIQRVHLPAVSNCLIVMQIHQLDVGQNEQRIGVTGSESDGLVEKIFSSREVSISNGHPRQIDPDGGEMIIDFQRLF